jgi:hypothetical protein
MNAIKKYLLLFFILTAFLAPGVTPHLLAQNGGELKWLRIGSLHHFFSEQGTEVETPRITTGGVNDGLFWPAEYGYLQISTAGRAMWVGTEDYYEPALEKEFKHKVVGVGPRNHLDRVNQIMEAELKLIGKFDHPMVIVDDEIATDNQLNDALDEIDESIPCDRILLIKNHSAIGVTITRKAMAFSQPNHDNYFIYEYTLKNTGIVDREGTVRPRSLKNVVFYLNFRYSFAGESVSGYNEGWGTWESTWGRNTINHVVGTDPTAPDFEFRAGYAWYGPHSERPVDDWGCPNEQDDGVLAAPRFAGVVTLHADKSATDHTDDLYQPITTTYLGSDDVTTQQYSQFDLVLMTQKYEIMTSGHNEKTHAEELGYVNSAADIGAIYANEWGTDAGGYCLGQGFGPYDMEPGDSVQIIIAEGVSGLYRHKSREVGRNWLEWENGTSKPKLIMPDGSETTDHNAYKKAWVVTGEDSILQTFRNALSNYANGYDIPQPPPPPELFQVQSGGDRIRLTWTDNATSHPHFDGYQIYRSGGNVMDATTIYEKIFECDASNVVHVFDDTTARRGFDYYYYIQSKDDGSTNDVHPGKPMTSSKFYTMTNKGATLKRMPATELEAIRVVPNPYDIRLRQFQFHDPGVNNDNDHDRLAFFEIPPFCKIRIYTERGDLIWEKEHNDGSGDEYWNLQTTYGQVIVSGIYIAHFEVTEDYVDSRTGEQTYTKGQSTYRKFMVFR